MDKETAEKLYHSCYMKVYSYVMTLAKNEDAASEITQETFFRAISTKQTFRGESECYSWLCAIAKNIFIDGTRKASRNQGELDETYADSSTDIEQSTIDAETSFRIHMLLHEMDELAEFKDHQARSGDFRKKAGYEWIIIGFGILFGMLVLIVVFSGIRMAP